MHRITLVGVAFALGCASSNTAPGSAPAETARIIGQGGMQAISTGAAPIAGESFVAAPISKVWDAIPAIYDSLGIAPTTIDAGEHMFGNRGLQIRRHLGGVLLSRYLDCGSPQARPSADFYDVNLSVITQLTRVDSATTRVLTTVDAMARPVSFSGEYVRCATTGEIEARIARRIEAAATR